MKKAICILFLLQSVMSCGRLAERGEGELRISFTGYETDVTRSDIELPDTSDFVLSVSDSEGNIIYEGPYGDSPESMSLKAGSYVVKAVSVQFEKPKFSAPQFGDEQCVLVPEGSTVNVRLECVQLNSGIRLRIAKAFLTAYPSASLVLRSESGSLLYSYGEKRTAYFQPGNVSLVLSQGAEDKILMKRRLEAREILSLGVDVVSDQGGTETDADGISIAVDTARYWIDETFVIGGSNGKGDSESMALTVSQAKASVGEEDVWVSGYVVGGDLTSASASFEEPFTSRTNLVMGSRTSTSDRESCISVALPSGKVRDGLNLVDNPGMLGRKICIRGDIVEAYYGLVGVKNVSDFKLL